MLQVDHDVCDKLASNCTFDGSVLVRAELVVALQWFVIDFDDNFANLFNDLIEKIEQNPSVDKRNRKFSVSSYLNNIAITAACIGACMTLQLVAYICDLIRACLVDYFINL